ncbi:ELM1/GtrOC1 family putative glycosyltransferase [Marinibactrum halimedae]|uniref:Nucleoside-diphosphate sugar epimerase n=1 Tax=Marinibactrum halimedae TaxID=1444977 RepID=A0AA37WNH1_9GAMM|nr:ELM1/GtrOC1 family putative glycosyltransferase [Marinibactrum halimedae]MCD9458139.1 mitochondrial fission ELM1 family protein [Marinibactrum halimedae]GLS25072.1 hypothetical protein GCM10007877_07860 [Marinibactrum halimedae]
MLILVLHDGKAGHLSQSLGLAKLVREQNEFADIVTAEAHLRFPSFKKAARKWCQSNRLWAQYFTRLGVYTYRKWILQSDGTQLTPRLCKPDLIISFGGKLVALNVVLSRFWNVPNIVIGDPHKIPHSFFSAIIRRNVKKHHDRNNNHIIRTGIALSRTERESALDSGQRLIQQSLTGQRRYWSLLIGGNGSGYRYNKKDWRQLAEFIRQCSEEHGVYWLISSSRRTTPESERYFRQCLLDSGAITYVASGIWFHEDQQGDVMAFLGAGDRLFVTEDSLSMISEAVAMIKPVVTLQPSKIKNKGANHVKAIKYMEKQGLLQRMTIERPEHFQTLAPKLSYEDHCLRIAEQLDQLNLLHIGRGHQGRQIEDPISHSTPAFTAPH